MGYSIIKSSAYKHEQAEENTNEYLIDSPEDIGLLKGTCAPGSIAYTANMQYVAMMDNHGNWVRIV